MQIILMMFLLLRCTHGYKPADNAALRTAVKDWCSSASAAQSKYGQHIGEWDTSLITSMDDLFCSATGSCNYGNTGCMNFNENIASWDVSQVTSMVGTFYAALYFNQDLSSWDVSKVTNMWWMFGYSLSFNQDLSSWNVGLVTNMEKLFYNAESFSQIICWDLNPAANTQDIVAGTSGASVNKKDSNICKSKGEETPVGVIVGVIVVLLLIAMGVLIYFFPGIAPWNWKSNRKVAVSAVAATSVEEGEGK